MLIRNTRYPLSHKTFMAILSSIRNRALRDIPSLFAGVCFIIILQLMSYSSAFSAEICLGCSGNQVETTSPAQPYETDDNIKAINYEIRPNVSVTFRAGTEIILSPGFIANPNSTFTASIIKRSVSGTATYNSTPFAGKKICISGTTKSGALYQEIVTTDAQGRYTFSAPIGTYTIYELEDGYALKDGYIDVSVTNANVSLTMNLEIVEINPNLAYFYQDILGNTMVETDDGGNLLLTASYQPFGDTYSFNTEGSFKETHLFTGKEFDKAGLYNFGARYYDPAIGRFLSIDPAGGKPGDPQTWNRYAYCLNNPYKYVDPDGREVRLETHEVFFGFNHSKVTIIPDNQAKWKKDERFKNNKTADGRYYATLGAGPEHGNLVSDTIRKKDVNRVENTYSAVVNLPPDMKEDDFITLLFNTDRKYKDRLDYDIFPSKVFDGYNSNGYASGLIKATTGTMPPQPPDTPGFNKPVPESSFK